MAKRSGPSRTGTRPTFQGLTRAQLAANYQRYRESQFTIMGDFARGQLITDGRDVYRIITNGVRMELNVSGCCFAVRKVRAPAEWRATMFLRDCIEHVLRDGMQERTSRDDSSNHRTMTSARKARAIWRDTRFEKLPSGVRELDDILTVHDNLVRVVRPSPHTGPRVAWIKDARTCKRILDAITHAPSPVDLMKVTVTVRRAGQKFGTRTTTGEDRRAS
jgi:hypothetical protein